MFTRHSRVHDYTYWEHARSMLRDHLKKNGWRNTKGVAWRAPLHLDGWRIKLGTKFKVFYNGKPHFAFSSPQDALAFVRRLERGRGS